MNSSPENIESLLSRADECLTNAFFLAWVGSFPEKQDGMRTLLNYGRAGKFRTEGRAKVVLSLYHDFLELNDADVPEEFDVDIKSRMYASRYAILMFLLFVSGVTSVAVLKSLRKESDNDVISFSSEPVSEDSVSVVVEDALDVPVFPVAAKDVLLFDQQQEPLFEHEDSPLYFGASWQQYFDEHEHVDRSEFANSVFDIINTEVVPFLATYNLTFPSDMSFACSYVPGVTSGLHASTVPLQVKHLSITNSVLEWRFHAQPYTSSSYGIALYKEGASDLRSHLFHELTHLALFLHGLAAVPGINEGLVVFLEREAGFPCSRSGSQELLFAVFKKELQNFPLQVFDFVGLRDTEKLATGLFHQVAPHFLQEFEDLYPGFTKKWVRDMVTEKVLIAGKQMDSHFLDMLALGEKIQSGFSDYVIGSSQFCLSSTRPASKTQRVVFHGDTKQLLLLSYEIGTRNIDLVSGTAGHVSSFLPSRPFKGFIHSVDGSVFPLDFDEGIGVVVGAEHFPVPFEDITSFSYFDFDGKEIVVMNEFAR